MSHVLLMFYVAGLVTGWCFPVHRRRKPASGPETPEQSLARLSHRPGVRMGGGQVVMGPNQPRPQVQSQVPGAPPRGYQGTRPSMALAPPRPVRSATMPTRGTSGGSGQARGV